MQSSELAKKLIIEKYENLNSERLQHILGVAEMAETLAKRYQVDVNKALTAAYMHDYCKYDHPKDIEPFLSEQEKEECREFPFLYHAYGSAYKYLELIGTDKDIFNAIYHHVFGCPNMSMLEAIIMISDYTEKNRKYENCVTCRNILLDGKFEEAILFSLEKTIELVQQSGGKVFPLQQQVYEEYKERVMKK